jgi:inner membrane protein YidH
VPETVDYGTRLSERRTRLALERSFVAAERTLMAWIRTALSMISFGFTIAKVLEALETERGLTYGIFGHSWSPTTLGIALITIGTGALVVAVIQHRATLNRLRHEGLTPRWSLALVVATLMSLLGLFAFGSLMLNV